MKRLLSLSVFGLSVLFFNLSARVHDPGGYKLMEAGFCAPPDSIQTSVYWYWVSGNVSKEGVVKDLESMNEAGINRAFIGNIWIEGIPAGDVELFTGEWWEIVHAALKRAGELDIEIGMFNCPGWSQAGGPWTGPDQAMRYLDCADTVVSGGRFMEFELPRPKGEFRDVKVLAMPERIMRGAVLDTCNATITSVPSYAGTDNLIDGNPDTRFIFEHGRDHDVILDIKSDEDFTLRSVEIQTGHTRSIMNVEVQARDGGDFRTLAVFDVVRTMDSPEVGFIPWAPVVASVPATTGREFRVVLSSVTGGSEIVALKLGSVPKVERYAEKTLAKMVQDPLPYWKEYQWPVQPALDKEDLVNSAGDVLDITPSFDGTRLRWDVPEGNWRVMRLGMVPTGTTNGPAAPEGLGLEVDKMTSAYLKHHFDSFIGEVLRRIPAEDRTTFKVVVADSYEKGGQNFTDTFLEDFRARYGYDALPYLPSYYGHVIGSADETDRFLWDMRRLVADRIAYEHIGGLRKIANSHGLTLWLENYGHWGFPAEFLQYGGQSDEIGGEFWSEGSLGDIENRAASSAAHIYGKNKVSAESFTSAGLEFARDPAHLKPRGDRFFSEGINNTLLHVYISQAAEPIPPGFNAWFGTEFNRMNTWFPHIDLFTSYLKRVNFMLQQGLNVADVAYFIGEDAPKMTGITEPELPKGYQYDYINGEVILEKMFVEDGMLTLPHGTRYRILVLPPLTTMRPELLAKIEQLVIDGGTVLGPAPERSPSLEGYPGADRRVGEISSRLWGEIKAGENYAEVGKGKVIWGMTMPEALALTGCPPDFRVADDVPVLYGHRTLPEGEIYFVTNQSGERLAFEAAFRTAGMVPELWNPVDGRTRSLPMYRENGRYTEVGLELERNESCFVVFRKVGRGQPVNSGANYPVGKIIPVDGTWELTFEPGRRGPAKPVYMEKLVDLGTSGNDSIRYYSGLVRYRNGIELDALPEGRTLLNLGHVAVTAKVYVNGNYAGGAWTPPYTVDITDQLKTGENKIEIEVANTWVNRLIGDSRLPSDARPTYSPVNNWRPDSPLQRTGLMGPVFLESIVYN